jgi:ABC-type nitrate/sulfonate/bicarbonate transport system permease component
MTTATESPSAAVLAASAKTAPASPRRRGMPRQANYALEIVVPIGLIAWWWFGSAGSADPFFPPLATVMERFVQLWGSSLFFTDVLPSLLNLTISYGIAVFAGIAVGTLMGSFRAMRWLLDPVLQFWRAIPGVALIPVFIALLGFGDGTRVFLIAIAAVFPTLIATADGVRAVDPLLTDVSRVYQLTPIQRVFSVRLPAAGPQIATGMQISLQVAFIVMIASEMMGASRGIGAKTLLAQQSYAIADMWAGIVLLGVLGYLINLLFTLVRNRALRWYIAAQKLGDNS